MNLVQIRYMVSAFGNTREDKQITAEIAIAKAMGGKAGKYIRWKLDPEFVARFTKPAANGRNKFIEMTLPYDPPYQCTTEEGATMVQAWHDGQRVVLNEIKDKMVLDYPAEIEKAKQELGTTFNELEYPSPEKFRSSFDVRISFRPLGSADSLPTKIRETYGKAVSEQLELQLAAAKAEPWNKLKTPIQELIGTMKGDNNKFHGTKITNITKAVEIVRKLNFMNDPMLDKACTEAMETLSCLDPNTLKKGGAKVKQNVAKAAESILSLMSAGSKKVDMGDN